MAEVSVAGSSGYIGRNVIIELAGAEVEFCVMARKLITDDVLKKHKTPNFFTNTLEQMVSILTTRLPIS